MNPAPEATASTSDQHKRGKTGTKMRRRLATLGAVLTMTIGAALVVAPPADAAVYYHVNMSQACKDTYNDSGSWAAFWNPWNPYSWYCSHLEGPYPPVYRWQGGVDIQKYCNKHYPGSKATVAPKWFDYWPIYRWACVRNS